MDKIIIPKVAIFGVPVHVMLVPFPIVCVTGALITDFVYSCTALIQWANFSAWFLAFALIFGGLAAIFGLIDFFSQPSAARPAIGWVHMGGNLAILVLAFINSLVHARDGWTSVVPTGLTLSVITMLVLLVTGFLGYRMGYRHVSRERP